MKSVFFLSLCLISCSESSNQESHFNVLSPIKPQSEQWIKLTGIPEFNVKIHSDGCSGGMSLIYSKLTFLHKQNGKTLEWRNCCEIHDRAYYYGGSKLEKKQADTQLSQCVTKVVGHQFLGKAMQIAVGIGGGPSLPTSYRWGYGEDFRTDN